MESVKPGKPGSDNTSLALLGPVERGADDFDRGLQVLRQAGRFTLAVAEGPS